MLGMLMIVTVAAGFTASCAVSSSKQRQVLEEEHRRAAGLFAQSLAAGLRSSMLTGDPLKTRELIRDAKGDLAAKGLKSVRVFAANGDEVFAPKGLPPERGSLAPPLRDALATRAPQSASSWFLPLAHEERCSKSVKMVESVRLLNLRRGVAEGVAIGVGINCGPAIVGAMGAEARMDYTAIGDTVNLGARLCSNASPWQVLVSAAVRDRAGPIPTLVYQSLEPLKVKGKEQPIAVFAVNRVGAEVAP
jgi:adenylate cyclase